ncbi:MAG: hypothetical protein JO297_03780 [Nitrososphaeraceae archaeon]|nr:hypothetical protein [Nitrososphaeraceae archaeon]
MTRSLFVVVLSFGLVTTLTIANMRSSYQETKTQSGKIRLFEVDAFSDLSRNLTSDSSASAGGGSSATTGTDNGGG